MPTYTFLCPSRACRTSQVTFDRNVPIADRDRQCCDTCGARLERQVAAPAFALRGIGWARDGYRRDGT